MTETLWRVFFLFDYNTRLVVLSTLLLGISSGLVGSFLLMRRRSLLGDALSHATLPGIALAFWAMVALGGSGKALGGLLAGAMATGILGLLAVLWVRRLPRIREDTALGMVLSVFYGVGVVLLGMVQQLPGASAAGLESFIYGKTASLVWSDFVLLMTLALLVLAVLVLLFKELELLCFDEDFAASSGWPVARLDLMLLVLACIVTVAGLQAVGLILIIAFLVIPPATARFWTGRFRMMVMLAGFFGGMSGWAGASLSALLPKLPAGAVIVLVAAGLFAVSAFLGTERGLLGRWRLQRATRRQTGRMHVLRALYEIREPGMGPSGQLPEGEAAEVDRRQLQAARSWSPRQLDRIVRLLEAEGCLERRGDGVVLTARGEGEAARVTRNHRLWEHYLMEYADVAPARVDRGADFVEHVLGAELTRELERRLPQYLRSGSLPVPASPHPLNGRTDS